MYVTTSSDEGAGYAGALAIGWPLLMPPFLLSRAIFLYANQALGWHSFYSVLLTLPPLAIIGAIVFALFKVLPKTIFAVLTGLYSAFAYFGAAQTLGLDAIWSAGIAVLVGCLGAWFMWWLVSDAQKAMTA